ncbi:hypothetical protein Aduo_005665 [Ancylostoma duodenale]
MVSSGEMDLGRPDRSLCDDYMFEPIPDDEGNTCEGVADEIDAINDETFGDDLQGSINSELEDYAAQTACLRLDDGAPWDTPGCSKAPAPDASNVPIPDFDMFGGSSFSSFGSETMAKLDSLWSQRSHNLYELWEEQKGAVGSRPSAVNQPQQNDVSTSRLNVAPNAYSILNEVSQTFNHDTGSSPFVPTRSPVLPPMPHGSTLEDLERQHLQNAAPIPSNFPVSQIKSAAVNATDLERRFIEEAAAVSSTAKNQIPHCVPQQTSFPSLPSSQTPHPRMAPNMTPNFGNFPPPMPLPPLLPPVHPLMLPLVPIWLEHLAGRTPCLPRGCPPIPPLLRMVFDTVKDPVLVMEMLRAAPGAPAPPPFPFPAQGFDRRTTWQRKPPGMPSGRTIEDLAFDQFAGYMSCKEREWLVKIQILQCQGTGVPYDDDYYYTMWREKQIALGWKPKNVNTAQEPVAEKGAKDHEQRRRRINGSRHDSGKEPKEIVPLNVKFAGSLGLPSKSSTNNPRHLISVEPSTENPEDDAAQRAGKQRKLRTLLLRLESAFSLLIECQDRRVKMRTTGQNSETLLSEISCRVDTVFRELMTEDLVKILQLGKGRSVVARTISVGCPKDVIRTVMALFSVMSSCPKKCLDDISSDLVPTIFDGLMTLNREQLMTLSSTLCVDSIKENLLNKNVFCRDALLTLLFACAKRKAISQGIVRWLCGPPENIDFVNGW